MNNLVNMDELGAVTEQVVIGGDLSPLTPAQRTIYYRKVCESVGLNPLTKPFAYIKLNGKLTLYALRDAADQLRRIRGISIEVVSQTIDKNVLTVHVRAKDKDGRTDEDYGCVPWSPSLAGDVASNQRMKAVTKAKRRVTLSISGLGWLDETETETIPEAQIVNAEGEAELAAPKRKSSYAAKKDGETTEQFNTLLSKVKDVKSAVEGGTLWKDNKKFLSTLPPGWYTNIAEEYSLVMAKYGVETDLPDAA